MNSDFLSKHQSDGAIPWRKHVARIGLALLTFVACIAFARSSFSSWIPDWVELFVSSLLLIFLVFEMVSLPRLARLSREFTVLTYEDGLQVRYGKTNYSIPYSSISGVSIVDKVQSSVVEIRFKSGTRPIRFSHLNDLDRLYEEIYVRITP